MRFKRFSAMLLALAMCMGVFSTTVFAYSDESATTTTTEKAETVETVPEKTEDKTSEELPYEVVLMSYFGTIYADEDLPHRARAVYMYLRDRSGTAGSCWPGINTIASDLHLSRSTVKRALNELTAKGYLQKESRFRPNGSSTSNLYTIR